MHPEKDNRAGERFRKLSHEKQMKELRVFNLEKKRLREDFITLYTSLKGGCR